MTPTEKDLERAKAAIDAALTRTAIRKDLNHAGNFFTDCALERSDLHNIIAQALADERERCAKVAEAAKSEYPLPYKDECCRKAIDVAAAAIRKGAPDV